MSKNKGGRPPKYNATYHPLLAESLAKNGLIDKEIAEKLGITERTINRWKNKYPEFCQSLKRGKDCPDDMVENALLQNALGYEYEEKEYIYSDGKETLKSKKVKYIKPDTTAQIFWLKNRRKEKWRDRQEIDLQGRIDVSNFDVELSEEEEAEYKQRLKEFFGPKMLEE